MPASNDPYRLSAPSIFLFRMLVFLVLAALIAVILNQKIQTAFMANPGLNSVIIGALLIGIVLSFRQVQRLFREVRWVNSLKKPLDPLRPPKPPVLLAPMATMLGDQAGRSAISTITLRAILDSIGTRLDESREIARYLTGLLVFLGLLGTFWGLLETVGSIGGVIKSMQSGNDAGVMFDNLKNGLQEPLAGISISFTASLFGLSGSLILGFLDLQAGQAQNRFYNELEDYLSASALDTSAMQAAALPQDLQAALAHVIASHDGAGGAPAAAMANLAEGIQNLVQHMRQEQQMIRDWVEAQADQQKDIRKLLERLAVQPKLSARSEEKIES